MSDAFIKVIAGISFAWVVYQFVLVIKNKAEGK